LFTVKVICAPDGFKESLSAAEAARAMARGVSSAQPNAKIDLCPIADGGEGTVDALLAATRGTERVTKVCGPLGEPILARWGLLGTGQDGRVTAAIEMAAASGMALLDSVHRDPTRTSTYGTGQLIAAALDAGAQRIILGIGGSATNDGGCGAAAALGARFIGPAGRRIEVPITGGMLAVVTRIDLNGLDARLANTEVVVASDVTNPLTGPHGAAHVYGPQKGATPSQIRQLDDGLGHLAALTRDQLGCDISTFPGAGAAGGMGAGMVAFLGARLEAGAELILDAVEFDRRAQDCNLSRWWVRLERRHSAL
jgi:glycerate kinase